MYPVAISTQSASVLERTKIWPAACCVRSLHRIPC